MIFNVHKGIVFSYISFISMESDGFTVVENKFNKKCKGKKIVIATIKEDNIPAGKKTTSSKIRNECSNCVPKKILMDCNKNIIRKRILCTNMSTTGDCHYGNNCVYAHSLEEQKIDPIRNKVYNIINSDAKLDDIDLMRDKELYNECLKLTQICPKCEKKICLGGYNCKNGAISREHVICYSDLRFGKCKDRISSNCTKKHLTDRGLVHYELQCMIFNGYQNDKNYINSMLEHIPKPIELTQENLGKFCNLENVDIDSVDSLSDDNLSLSSSDSNKFILTILD